MMKFITTIAAFSLTFILSVALVGFPKTDYDAQFYQLKTDIQTEQNISYLLDQDIRNGSSRDGNISDTDLTADSTGVSAEYAKTINRYVDASSSLDDSQLPADFQLAWQNHMHAWRVHANFLNQSSYFSKMQKMNNDDFPEIYNRQNNEITRTWRQVISVARKYGVTVSYKYY